MFNKFLLVPAVFSIAGLLMGADSAFAQRGGGGHGGGGHGGGGHAGGGGGRGGGAHFSGGHVSGGHVHSGHVGGFHNGVHHNGFHRGGVFDGGYYPGIFGGSYPWYDSYAYPSYSYYYDPAPQYYSPPVQYYPPPTQYYDPPAQAVADYANVRVIVPDPQARVWFDGSLTSQTGKDRLYHTPSLTAGSTYSYQIRASWMQDGREVSQERTVSVKPGQTTVGDFTR
jgi:uncharacterized protein (TIGR03000 family)